jgi:hypothetical protein
MQETTMDFTPYPSCLGRIPGPQGACQVRAERTAGELAVSQVIRSRAGAEKSAPVSCQTNSELPLSRGGSFINLLSPGPEFLL